VCGVEVGWRRHIVQVEVPPLENVRLRAEQLLTMHPLLGADAFQLAAVVIAAKESTANHEFMTGDLRLSNAAEHEGFRVL